MDTARICQQSSGEVCFTPPPEHGSAAMITTEDGKFYRISDLPEKGVYGAMEQESDLGDSGRKSRKSTHTT